MLFRLFRCSIEGGEKLELIRCDKCGYSYQDHAIRTCPHPAVNRIYGKHICVYCCSKCKYAERFDYIGGVGCGYANAESQKEDT